MDQARIDEIKAYFDKEGIKFYSHYDNLIETRLRNIFKLTDEEIEIFFESIYGPVQLERTQSVLF